MEWETVIGLEIHAQLATRSKIFSSSATAYGAEPNTQANLVDLGYPGVLPVLNGEAVRMAVKFGLGGTKCASLLPALPIQSRPSNASSTPGEEYCRLRRSIYGPTCWQMAILK